MVALRKAYTSAVTCGMVNYRRNFAPGGTCFFTVNLRDRSSRLLVEHISLLRAAFRTVKRAQPFHIEAIVVLPEHLHTIWALPAGDTDYPDRWRAIKRAFSRAVVKSGIAIERNAKGEYALWQRRYWERTLAGEAISGITWITSIQPGQARVCQACCRLAVFIIPSLRAARYFDARLGRQRKCRKVRRVESSPDAAQRNPGLG